MIAVFSSGITYLIDNKISFGHIKECVCVCSVILTVKEHSLNSSISICIQTDFRISGGHVLIYQFRDQIIIDVDQIKSVILVTA